jgi:hypothetical protein
MSSRAKFEERAVSRKPKHIAQVDAAQFTNGRAQLIPFSIRQYGPAIICLSFDRRQQALVASAADGGNNDATQPTPPR